MQEDQQLFRFFSEYLATAVAIAMLLRFFWGIEHYAWVFDSLNPFMNVSPNFQDMFTKEDL